eukprot:gb/GFBE01074009.1/.p1 GENE.gb/GFBE01074009.1/~~gb/GFBE01074009.1/.p1  ORF type:complete len:321 (+),score=53.75 gb/GFBE01074009.1/:1-963(+)
MSFTCGSANDSRSCTSVFRKSCWQGPMVTRTASLVRLLAELHVNGTHDRDGDCALHTDVAGSQMWMAQLEGVGRISMCISSNGLPLGLASDPAENLVGPWNVRVATYNFSFHNVSLGPQAMEAPTCPRCAVVAPCSGGGVVTMELLRLTLGGGEPWDQIWNLDIVDLAGEIMFDYSFSRPYLKVFNVTLNSSFGPGRDCNFVNGENHISAPREPGLATLVARRDAEGFSSACGGQCGNNEFGSWYAFPKEGGCAKGAPIGTDGCTWQVNSVKVVATDCMKSADVVAAASKDSGHLPLSLHTEALIWERIAACPDVRSLRR